MALHFNRVGPATAELEIWSASERSFSFVVSHESSSGPGLRGRPGFVVLGAPSISASLCLRVWRIARQDIPRGRRRL